MEGRMMGRWLRVTALLVALGLPLAAPAGESCYRGLPVPAEPRVERALYVMVDQTTPLDEELKARVRALVADWGREGDHLELARFSANIRGYYPELVFEGTVERVPDEAYLFQLRYDDKQRLLRCLESQRETVRNGFAAGLETVLAGMDYKIPKTDLFYALHLLSERMIDNGEAPERVVLLVTDGLENSAVTSFYHRGRVRKIDPRRELAKVRKAGLLANWKGSRIYVYGLGLMPDAKDYLDPRRVMRLKAFWERYFVAGNGEVMELGTPEFFRRRLE